MPVRIPDGPTAGGAAIEGDDERRTVIGVKLTYDAIRALA
jgi:hypothetical protein